MRASPEEGIRVSIYDQEYSMRGPLDPGYLRMLAQYVDQKMRSVAERTHTVDSLRTAILTALNLADEYHQLRAQMDAATQQVDQKVGECHLVLDRLLSMLD